MTRLRDVLITDRTQQDVNARNDKGTYNDVDLNRVLRACSWLAGQMERYGYSVPFEYFPAVLIHTTVKPPYSGRADSILAYKGETATVKAVSGGGYEFIRWEENGKVVSTAKEYRFAANVDRELTAIFSTIAGAESSVVGLAVVGSAILGKDVV